VNLTGGGLSGGYRTYLEALLPRLAAHPDVTALDVFVPQAVQRRLTIEGVRLESWADGELRQAVIAREPDVAFIPTARWTSFGSIPTVVMVRNMEPLVAPLGGNPVGECVRNIGRSLAARHACSRATRIIAVSEFVRRFLLERWRVRPTRVATVYHGVERRGFSDDADRPALLPREVTRFVFTAGSIRPARGIEDAICAMALPPLRDQSLALVIAGGLDRDGSYAKRLLALAGQLGIATRVHWVGELDRSAMSWCYSRCGSFIMTSRVEACPNIALEAMAHGAEIVSTTCSPMPEFFGEAAQYYSPGDAATLTARLSSIVLEPRRDRNTHREISRARAGAFTWERTSLETVSQLQLAIASRVDTLRTASDA
jgi:glycosyltransferase involved in cell wall biosynthesis